MEAVVVKEEPSLLIGPSQSVTAILVSLLQWACASRALAPETISLAASSLDESQSAWLIHLIASGSSFSVHDLRFAFLSNLNFFFLILSLLQKSAGSQHFFARIDAIELKNHRAIPCQVLSRGRIGSVVLSFSWRRSRS
jgi:hypothetical protein